MTYRPCLRDIDGTTEVAALVVMGAGVLGGLGELRLSAALTTLTVLLLVEKPRLHRLVDRIDETTLLAAARVAVMSVVVLPLLPEGSFGPAPGVRPRGLWILVMMFSGMSFAGYVAQRLAGAAGYPITGLLGGLVSSTSVTLTFARLSRSQAGQASPLATRLPSSMRRCSRRWASTSQRRLLRGCWHSPWRGARCADRARDGGRIPGRVVRGSLLAHADGRGRRDVRPGVTLTFRARPLQPIVSNAPMTFGRSAATGEVMKMSSEA